MKDPINSDTLSALLAPFPRIELIAAPTPLEYLQRLSAYAGRDIYIKRDDLTPLGLGGNKLRKLEFLAADAVRLNADTLVTAGAIQSNHVRQTAAVAARLGMRCVALLENPIATQADNYLNSGNRLLLDYLGCEIELVDELHQPDAQLNELSDRLQARGARPYAVPVGGSNALGSLGYVNCAAEIARQAQALHLDFAAVVVPSGSAGTHAGLAVGLQQVMPQTELVGVTVSRTIDAQQPKVLGLQQEVAALLHTQGHTSVTLWDDYFAPMYGMPNEQGMEAIRLLARLEGLMLDPVYTGKAMSGLLDGISRHRFNHAGPVLFVHTGGAPALFAYTPEV